jgi:hypothetical protein
MVPHSHPHSGSRTSPSHAVLASTNISTQIFTDWGTDFHRVAPCPPVPHPASQRIDTATGTAAARSRSSSLGRPRRHRSPSIGTATMFTRNIARPLLRAKRQNPAPPPFLVRPFPQNVLPALCENLCPNLCKSVFKIDRPAGKANRTGAPTRDPHVRPHLARTKADQTA